MKRSLPPQRTNFFAGTSTRRRKTKAQTKSPATRYQRSYITAGFRSEEEYNNFMDEHEEEFAAGADEFLRWYIDVESRH